MAEHEFIHDASCTECGVQLRTMTFPPHALKPLKGGYVDGDGKFWPTCGVCGRIHRTDTAEARIATLEAENAALLECEGWTDAELDALKGFALGRKSLRLVRLAQAERDRLLAENRALLVQRDQLLNSTEVGYVAGLIEERDRLLKGLAKAKQVIGYEAQGYGSFPGGDPRNFTPDEEVNTPEELAAWKAACEAWDRGDGEDTGPQCQTMGDGSVVTGTGFGMGTYQWPHPAIEYIDAIVAGAALQEETES